MERRAIMDDKGKSVNIEEVLDTEIDEIWDIFFPYMNEKNKQPRKVELNEQTKPRRYLRFLTMCF
jgi:hypothetical protein